MDKKIFFVMVTFNGEKLISSCLDSIFARKTDEKYQVIILDNHSSDQTVQLVKKNFPQVQLIENNQNLGFAKANNLGIKKALEQGADYIVLLNQDTEAAADFIKKGIEYFEKKANISMASPLILYPDKKRIWFAGAKIYRGREILSYPKARLGEHLGKKGRWQGLTNPVPLDWLPACALWIKKEVFEAMGYFDESFFMYGEDIDFSLRAKKAGFNFGFIDTTFVIHKENFEQPLGLNKYWLKKFYYRTAGRVKIIRSFFSLSEKCYYMIKLFYWPFFQIYHVFKKLLS